jgi:hypothetical protein
MKLIRLVVILATCQLTSALAAEKQPAPDLTQLTTYASAGQGCSIKSAIENISDIDQISKVLQQLQTAVAGSTLTYQLPSEAGIGSVAVGFYVGNQNLLYAVKDIQSHKLRESCTDLK